MLSSKLVISFLVIYLAYYFIISFSRKTMRPVPAFSAISVFLIIVALISFTQNPVSKRFNDIFSGDASLAYRQQFAPGIYFNGVQFRLLEWRFVSQILTEKNAWLTGVSTGDAQKLLDDIYISTNMYIGEPGSNDHGFLGYDTHNEFLQSVLQSGIPGLLAFIFVCYTMIHLAVRRKNIRLSAIVILLIAYSFMEAGFEGQYGLILFTFFPLLIYFGSDEKYVK
jgi:O-antigen ligase